MIRVNRGAAPPDIQKKLHEKQLELMGFYYECLSDPSKDDIKGYDIAKDLLWRAQHKKCCYCEFIEQQRYNDVEHWRPKLRANRKPGSNVSIGYWWLAFHWQNLFFACAGCNRSEKNDSFPLSSAEVLVRGENPPGREKCLLINPAEENGIKHIAFYYDTSSDQWRAKPRIKDDLRAETSIKEYGLNREELIELYNDHIEQNVKHEVHALDRVLQAGEAQRIGEEFSRIKKALLVETQRFVGLSYDALLHFVPNQKLAPWGLEWPDLCQ